MFCGGLRGVRAAAAVYALIGSCKLANLAPVDHLSDVLIRVATLPASPVAVLLPDG